MGSCRPGRPECRGGGLPGGRGVGAGVWGAGHTVAMVAWADVEGAEPEFAARVRRLFGGGRHKTIATLRADGSPRISGIECEFADGERRFGSMEAARKGADLKQDPRVAL